MVPELAAINALTKNGETERSTILICTSAALHIEVVDLNIFSTGMVTSVLQDQSNYIGPRSRLRGCLFTRPRPGFMSDAPYA